MMDGLVGAAVSAALTLPIDMAEVAASARQLPLVVFSPGFLVAKEAYESYHRLLASWG